MGTECLEWCDGCSQSTCSMQLSLQWNLRQGLHREVMGKEGSLLYMLCQCIRESSSDLPPDYV